MIDAYVPLHRMKYLIGSWSRCTVSRSWLLSWKPPSPWTQIVRLPPLATHDPIEPGRPVPIAPRLGAFTTRWLPFTRWACRAISLQGPELPGAIRSFRLADGAR